MKDTHRYPDTRPAHTGTRIRLGRCLALGLLPLLVAPILLISAVSSCTRSKPVAQSDYAIEIVGSWLGTVGDRQESITFRADGGFAAQLYPLGFLSNTLSQGVTGKIGGTWAIDGNTITLNISDAEDERLENGTTSSTIVTFRTNELEMKSSRGEVSRFSRTDSL